MDQLMGLLMGIVLLASLPLAFAHMLGGGGWSGQVMRLYTRILRSIFAFPFLLVGRLFTGAGGKIKGGGGKKKRKP